MISVLIMEDDVELADSFRATLMEAGHDVTVTHNGAAAWDILMRQPHDVVLTDLYIARDRNAERGAGGLSLVGKIRAARREGDPAWMKDMRVVVITGAAFVAESSLQLALELGADLCLQKPVDPDVILAAVEGTRSAS
jgi:CheY-like chemotaxis protein